MTDREEEIFDFITGYGMLNSILYYRTDYRSIEQCYEGDYREV